MKKIFISIVCVLCVFVLKGQYTVTLDLQEATVPGCGNVTNCGIQHTVCYNLFATPSENGAWLASYDIWYLINGATGNQILYASDATCIIFNGNDLPASGATTFIRVGANQGNPGNLINGRTRIHNFCITYTTVQALNNSTLAAGVSFNMIPSNMSVDVSGVPTNAVIIPATLTFSSSNNTCLIPLPVRWLSFEATKQSQASKLTWSTADEINCKAFEVENSVDGIHFEKIGEVEAKNTPDDINTYSFMDYKPFNGMNYYRIRQIDIDGNFDLSQIRTVRFDGHKLNYRVWPNPVNSFLNIEINSSSKNPVLIKLFNSAGQVVINREVGSGGQDISVDLTGMEPGLYSLLIETASDTYIEKIVVVK